jgi:hypothetical protein
VSTYFSDSVSKAEAYKRIEALARTSRGDGWKELARIRHDLLHERSLWLAIEVKRKGRPRYEPLFVLNWRPGSVEPKDCVTLQTLRIIVVGLHIAANRLVKLLIRRIRAGDRGR